MMASNTITVKYSEYRPCLVDGKKALFHRFAEGDQILFQCGRKRLIKELINHETANTIPDRIQTNLVKIFSAIVEFEDGTVKKVDMKSIRFLDSENLFQDAFNKIY